MSIFLHYNIIEYLTDISSVNARFIKVRKCGKIKTFHILIARVQGFQFRFPGREGDGLKRRELVRGAEATI